MTTAIMRHLRIRSTGPVPMGDSDGPPSSPAWVTLWSPEGGLVLQWHPAALLYATSVVACLAVAMIGWRRGSRSSPAVWAFLVTTIGLVEWSGAAGISGALTDPAARMTAGLACFAGIGILPAGMFVYTRALATRDRPPGRLLIAALAVEPAVIMTLAATNSTHHLVLRGDIKVTSWGLVTYHGGPAYLVNLVYTYLLLTTAMIIAVRGWLIATPIHRRQLGSLLIGSILPAVAGLWSFARPGGAARNPDITPLLFTVTAMVAAWALFRHGLLQIIPVARQLVLERLSDAVFVIDVDERILDLNPAGAALIRTLRPDLPERIVGLSGRAALPSVDGSGPLSAGGWRTQVNGSTVDLDIRITELPDRRGHLLGHVMVIRDISELGQERRKLTAANDQLRAQVQTIERLRAELAEQAFRDVLTGLHNRRYLIEALDTELAQATIEHLPFSVLLLDLDHFKWINDTHGHAVGDDLLIAIANALAGAVRSCDTVARYGGEEFVVLLPATPAEAARERAEVIRVRCAAACVPSGSGWAATTISAGIATFPMYGRNAKQLLAAADKALYRAKASGRDRVLLAT